MFCIYNLKHIFQNVGSAEDCLWSIPQPKAAEVIPTFPLPIFRMSLKYKELQLRSSATAAPTPSI